MKYDIIHVLSIIIYLIDPNRYVKSKKEDKNGKKEDCFHRRSYS